MNASCRVGLWAAVVVLSTSGLAACGGGSDAARARTTACRTYLVGGGAGDTALAADLLRITGAMGTDAGVGYDAGSIKVALVDIRAGAATAGRTGGLSDADFAVFEAVAAAATGVERALSPVSDTEGLDQSGATALDTAVKGVHKLCG